MRRGRLMMLMKVMMSLSVSMVAAGRRRHGVLARSGRQRRPRRRRLVSRRPGRRRDVALVAIQRRRRQRTEVVLAAEVGRHRPSTAAGTRHPAGRRRIGRQTLLVQAVAMPRRRRTRFQIVEVAVTQVDLDDAHVVAAGTVGVRYQPERVRPFLLVTADVDHAAVAVEREHDWAPRLATSTTVGGAPRPRGRRLVVVLGQNLRVLHEEVVLFRHAAGRTAVRLRTVGREQPHAVEMLLLVTELFLTTSILLAALAVEPQERDGDERQQDDGEDDVRHPEEAERQRRLRCRRRFPAGVRRPVCVVDGGRDGVGHHGIRSRPEKDVDDEQRRERGANTPNDRYIDADWCFDRRRLPAREQDAAST